MATLKDLAPEFQRFDALGSDDRKAAVRALEPKVRAGDIALSDSDLQLSRSSQFGLQRILAYLMLQEGRVPCTPSVLRAGLVSEMELLKRTAFEKTYSRMPLYYAARAYVERLKGDRSLLPGAVDDITLLNQIEADLSRHAVDRGGQVLPKIKEAAELLREVHDKSPNPAITAAQIARRGAVVVAVIAFVGVVVTALIGTCSN